MELTLLRRFFLTLATVIVSAWPEIGVTEPVSRLPKGAYKIGEARRLECEASRLGIQQLGNAVDDNGDNSQQEGAN